MHLHSIEIDVIVSLMFYVVVLFIMCKYVLPQSVRD